MLSRVSLTCRVLIACFFLLTLGGAWLRKINWTSKEKLQEMHICQQHGPLFWPIWLNVRLLKWTLTGNAVFSRNAYARLIAVTREVWLKYPQAYTNTDFTVHSVDNYLSETARGQQSMLIYFHEILST